MARQTVTKIPLPFFPPPCVSERSPFCTSPQPLFTVNTQHPAHPTLPKWPDIARSANLHSASATPNLRFQGICQLVVPPQAYKNRESPPSYCAASLCGAPGERLRRNDLSQRDGPAGAVGTRTAVLSQSSSSLLSCILPPVHRGFVCTAPQMQHAAPQKTTKWCQEMYSLFPRCPTTCESVPALSKEFISNVTRTSSLSTSNVQPSSEVVPPLSKLVEDELGPSCLSAPKPLPETAERRSPISVGSASTGTAIHELQNSFASSSLDAQSQTSKVANSGNYDSPLQTAKDSTPFTADNQIYLGSCQPASCLPGARDSLQCGEAVTTLNSKPDVGNGKDKHQDSLQCLEEVTTLTSRHDGGNGMDYNQASKTRVRQLSEAEIVVLSDVCNPTVNMLPSAKENYVKESCHIVGDPAYLDSRESTSSTLSPFTSEAPTGGYLLQQGSRAKDEPHQKNRSTRHKQALLKFVDTWVSEQVERAKSQSKTEETNAQRATLSPLHRDSRSFPSSDGVVGQALYSGEVPSHPLRPMHSHCPLGKGAPARNPPSSHVVDSAASGSVRAYQHKITTQSNSHPPGMPQDKCIGNDRPQRQQYKMYYRGSNVPPPVQRVASTVQRSNIKGASAKQHLQGASVKDDWFPAVHGAVPQLPGSVTPKPPPADCTFTANVPVTLRHNCDANGYLTCDTALYVPTNLNLASPKTHNSTKKPTAKLHLSSWQCPRVPYKGTGKSTLSQVYLQKKESSAKTDAQPVSSIRRQVFTRRVHRVQKAAALRHEGYLREQDRNRAVLERVASAGLTTAAVTAAGTLLASSSPFVTGLAIAGAAALLTGLAAATVSADTPEFSRKHYTSQVSAAPYPIFPERDADSRYVTHNSGSLDRTNVLIWSLSGKKNTPKRTYPPAPGLSSIGRRGYSSLERDPALGLGFGGPYRGAARNPLPTPRILAMHPYGPKPLSNALLLLGRPMNAVVGR